jgi:hypothetical protein
VLLATRVTQTVHNDPARDHKQARSLRRFSIERLSLQFEFKRSSVRQ